MMTHIGCPNCGEYANLIKGKWESRGHDPGCSSAARTWEEIAREHRLKWLGDSISDEMRAWAQPWKQNGEDRTRKAQCPEELRLVVVGARPINSDLQQWLVPLRRF
jgi:hypothetical protein